MRARAALAVVGSLAVVVVALPARATNPHLERCRDLEGEFDYKGMVAECGIAAADADLTAEERVEASRLLGFAHTALGDDDAARAWFLRLLVLDPGHELPKDVSPRFRDAFARAARAFEEEGRVLVVHQPPSAEESLAGGPLTVAFDVTDKLARVASAKLVIDTVVDGSAGATLEEPLTKTKGAAQGEVRFEGWLKDPAIVGGQAPASYTLRYRLVLASASGVEVTPSPPLPSITLPRKSAPSSSFGGGEGELSPVLLFGGAAVAGGLLVAGVVGGSVALYCATGRCSSRQVQAPVGYVNVSIDQAAGAIE